MVLFFGKPIDPFFTDVFFMGVLYIVFLLLCMLQVKQIMYGSAGIFYLCCCVIPSQNKHVVVLM